MEFGKRLRELRKLKGLSQEQVGKELGFSARAYSHYENGERDPSITTLIKLCDFFDVTADYLIGRTDY